MSKEDDKKFLKRMSEELQQQCKTLAAQATGKKIGNAINTPLSKSANTAKEQYLLKKHIIRNPNDKLQKELQQLHGGSGTTTSNYEQFRKWSMGKFAEGEGAYLRVTLDNYGHPTIGIGTLIFHKGNVMDDWNNYKRTHPNATVEQFIKDAQTICNDKTKTAPTGSLAAWRKEWLAIGGKPELFDACVRGVFSGDLVPGGKDVQKIPYAGWEVKDDAILKYGGITKGEMEKMFNIRFDQRYNDAKRKIQNFDNQTDYARITAIHGLYMGVSSCLTTDMKQTLVNLNDSSSFIKSYDVREQLRVAMKEYNVPATTTVATNTTIRTDSERS